MEDELQLPFHWLCSNSQDSLIIHLYMIGLEIGSQLVNF